MIMNSMKFYWDIETDDYYLVNFQEERYMKIAEKGSEYYTLLRHIYCSNWEHREEFIDSYKLVTRIEQIDGSEE